MTTDYDLRTIADNEIRYRGVYFGNVDDLRKQYKVWNLSEEEAETVANYIRRAEIVLPESLN